MNIKIAAPVLLIAFNRPDTTEQVFQKIRETQPAILFVAVDGARLNKTGEDELVENVKQIVKQVDWECEVKYLFSDKNLGCKQAVVSAISWALKEKDRVIIIEDDIIPSPSFFLFAQELLEKYEDDDRIAMISANNYTPIKELEQDDYLFTKYGHIWGWATWKRVWNQFDVDLPYLKNDLENEYLKTAILSKAELKYMTKYANNILRMQESNLINTWDAQFAYYRIRNSLLSIIPRVNLASNIGINSSRTDTNAKINKHYFPAVSSFVLLKHPSQIECNLSYDKYHFENHISNKTSIIKRVIRKMQRIFHIA